MKTIKLNVFVGESKELQAVKEFKDHMAAARSTLLNKVKPSFGRFGETHQNITTETSDENDDSFQLYGVYDAEGEEELTVEILELCDRLHKKIEEYDALIKFQMRKAPEDTGANQ